jgi:hypothetical protein
VSVVTIGEFILTRVAEDEFLAGHMIGSAVETALDLGSDDVDRPCSWHPRRVLARCAVRRRLVESHRVGRRDATPCTCGCPGSACAPCHTLRALALEWADHPDYQAEWRAHPVPVQAGRTA